MTSPEFNNEKKRKDRQEPIAIVGMACIFPKADNLGEYWSNIVKKVDAITDIPSTHWKTEEFFNEDIKQPDHTYSQKGGFISPVPFDPLEFGIAPNAVEATDTSQLLGLVVAQQALNDAGYGKDRDFNREKVSVVLGVTGTLELVIPLGARLGHPRWRKALRDSGIDNTKSEEVVRRISDSYVGWQENSFPGLLGNVVAGRIANRLDFGGTNCVVDAACASSLSALHLGCLELGTGRSDMVITGGIDTFNDIFMYMCFSKTPVLSPTGHARPFDHKEDGTVLGEGIGMLILKRAGDAKRDKDKIYALIKGVGASSDGKGNAIYMPTSRGQSRALKDAYKRAGVTPESIGLVEAHGTGTKVGDATEVNALASVYSGGEKKDSWCALGSVKSQIGHTKAAAGMAGVIKSVMALQNKVLPPTIKVEKPIKEASPETTPFYINTESRPWLNDQETPRRAAVSAFGFGGSNFHCVLEEYHPEKISATWDYDIEVLAFSSSTVEGLCQQLRLFPRDLPWVQAVQEGSRIRREFNSSDSCRMAMVVTRNGKTIPQVVSGALQMLERSPEKKEWATPDNVFFENKESSSEKLGVIFPGQGSQYCGMLRDLACAFPSFHTALERADRSFRKLQGSNPGKKITDFIYPHSSFDEPTQQKGEKELRRTNVAQPSIGAVSLGAFRVLEEFGVSPVAFSGHSFGELTALSASGRLSEEDFFVLSSIRGDLMNAQSETEGGMIAVRWSEKNVEKFLLDEELDLVIANRNSPNQTVLSGPVKEIKKAAEVFLKNRVSHIQLPVSGAFHSPLVSSCKEPFFQSVKGVRLKSDFKPVFSNTTGNPYPKKSMDAKKLLSGQLAEPVEFVKLIENMYSAGVTTFLEVGPGSKLSKLILEILHAKPVKALSLDATSGKGSGLHDLAITLARLVTAGHNLDLSLWNPGVSGEKDLKNKKKVMTIPVCGANHFKPRETRTTAGVRSSSGSTAETTNNTIGRKKEVQVAAEKNGRGREKNARDLTVQTRPFSDTGNSGNNAVSRALQATQESMLALQKMQEETARLHSQFLEGQNRAQEALVALIDRQQSFFAGEERKNVPVTTVSPEPPTQKENGKRDSEKKEELSKNSFGTSIEKREGGNGKLPETEKTEGKVVQALLGVLSEKTGYPVEMLDLEMKMDSDLGIDSIKQVEILSALQERLPGSPEVGPEQMGKLQTLNQLALYLSAGLAKNGEKPNMEKDPPSVSAANGEVHTALLEIVSEKTGYPVEMLDLDMGMDSDLGIDSIKQVEILSALQERLPGSPEVEPEQMGKIQTLRDLAIHLAAGQESPRENDKEHFASHGGPPEEASFVHTTLLEIVSEKTGYPVEMLNPEMTMDSDLGIDSIKQVEILSALQERLPGSPEVEPDQMGRLQTLEDLASFLESNLPGQDSPPETSCTSGSGKKETSEIENVVLSVVSDKTGYPAEMLELDMGMDSDLGIDSIKQVEILSALSERLPDSPEVKPDQFGTLNTLRQLAMFLGASGNEPPNQVEEEKAKSEKAKEENHFDSIQRSVLVVEGLEPLAGREKVCIENGSPIWIVSDGSDLPMRVAEKLEGYGYRPVLLDFAAEPGLEPPKVIGGLVIIAPTDLSENFYINTLKIVQKAGPALRATAKRCGSVFLTVSRLDGSFGLNGLGSKMNPLTGGLAGFTKTISHEWPEINAKALDLTPNPSSVDFAAEQIVEEMFRRGPVEVGITKNGLTRLSLLKTAIPERGSRDVLNGEDLLLITGGGRGVTAEAAISIARAFRPKIILVGRTRLDNDSPLWLKGISDERDIKKAIAKNSNGHKPTPKYVDETYKRILAVREVTRTLQRIREAGSEVHYISTDITDRRVFQQVLTDVKERFGPLTGVLHGAGVLFDKRIEDKTSEQFEKVFETKVSSLSTILSSIDTEKLKTLVLFSSFTGRYGRIGQLDYGVANEVLNKIAQSQARVLKRCRVISLNWGPWDGGMVTPALKKIFQKEGVGLISLQAGAEYLVKEIASTGDRSVEIVVLGGKNSGPTEQPQRKAVSAEASPNTMKRAFRFDLEMGRFPFLKSHVLDGKPVLPMAMMIEWCANAALHENPGLHFSGFNNFRVLKGVVLEPQCLGSIEIWTGQPEKEGKWFLVPVEIRGIGEGSPSVFHAKGEFVLSGLLKEEPFSVEVQKGRLANYDESLIYSERLFHGKEFRGIVEMEECSHAGVQVLVKSAPPPSDWIAKPVRNSWVTDPLVIDSSFQAMILWTLDMYDTESLPCFVGKYRQYQGRFPQNGVRVKAEVLTSSEAFAQADIFFVDERNRCIAKIEKYECTLSRLLKKAFNGR